MEGEIVFPIYLDNNATTPVDPRVKAAVLPWLTDHFGNPSSVTYAQGVQANEALEKARAQVADLLGAQSHSEVYFTSGASEANAIAISGVIEHLAIQSREKGTKEVALPHIVTWKLEHNCVLGSCRRLERLGLATVTYVGVTNEDSVTYASDIEAALQPTTALVSIMLANNEIGVINDIPAIAALCAERNILLHVDGSQGVGKIPFVVREHSVDFLSVSAHKWYGPKGVGALYVRNSAKARVSPLVQGGRQEGGLRGGTQNVLGIVGMGCAAALCCVELGNGEGERICALRDHTITRLRLELPLGCIMHLNGSITPGRRIPGNLSFSLPGCDRDALLTRVWEKVSFSATSACAAASGHTSHVLDTIGVSPDFTTMRLGFGRFSIQREVDIACDIIIGAARSFFNIKMVPQQLLLRHAIPAGYDLMLDNTAASKKQDASQLLKNSLSTSHYNRPFIIHSDGL